MSERKRPIGIIVLGHGSRRLEANKEVETIAQMLAQRQKIVWYKRLLPNLPNQTWKKLRIFWFNSK